MVSDDRPKAEHEIAADLRLRPEGPPVTRLSRKVLVGVASLAIVAVLGAVIWAFDSRRDREEAGPELYNTEHKSTADELAKLPRDYTGVPPGVSPLGPPLPGDLGRPMLQGRGPQGGADPEPARRAEAEAARTSRLFTSSTRSIEQRRRHRRRRGAEHLISQVCRFDPKHAGSQARVPEWPNRQAHRKRRAAGGTGLEIRRCRRDR
jgi:type IV secretory pathway VirB10-like protein